ncbi:hypothetical protein PGT21_031173 [Puccinia graminis f. sp. tritici]|uniref:Uncharacterized protein n=1 Tax=Puccinia graminis f. sp. tritici TaxID=56615 RepID=A0A5B0PH72_PUCGR|nr:hypothetical protein PGT21_031173 [Puccinia graminis f. sp. tritici]KAA1120648.1 hypothetical protein PGTUg99_016908 [Puccinia graminis f. sp. tritici]
MRGDFITQSLEKNDAASVSSLRRELHLRPPIISHTVAERPSNRCPSVIRFEMTLQGNSKASLAINNKASLTSLLAPEGFRVKVHSGALQRSRCIATSVMAINKILMNSTA